MFIIFYLKMKVLAFIKNFKLIKFQYDWKRSNKDNTTVPNSIFNMKTVSCGKKTYGKLNVVSYNNPSELLRIGNYCSISDNVIFLLGGEHHPEYISNYPFLLNIYKSDEKYQDNTTSGPIIIEDDVWIGRDVLVLSGVKIGQGAIIAAGSIVTKNVPPYAVYTTNRIIKYRFPVDIIEKLLLIDFSKLDDRNISYFIKMLYSKVDEDLLESEMFEKFINMEGK